MRRTLVFLSFLLFFASPSLSLGADLPEPIFTAGEDAPEDARFAASALAEVILGQAPASIQFPSTVGSDISEDRAALAGFSLTGTTYYRYAALDDNPEGRVLAGRLTLTDPLGREASTLFVMEYAAGGPGLVVSKVQATALFETEPASNMYVVPSEALKGLAKETFADYGKLLTFVVGNALTPDPKALPSEKGDYVLFVFLRQRLSPSATFAAKISPSRTGRGGYAKSTRILTFDNWRVALIPGKFRLNDIKPLFVKVVTGGGDEVGFFSRVGSLAGLYSTNNK